MSSWCAECESTVHRLLEKIEALRAGRNTEVNVTDVDGPVCTTCKPGVNALVGEVGAVLDWRMSAGVRASGNNRE